MTSQSSAPQVTAGVLEQRVLRARAAMERHGVDVLLLSLGADLPYLTGYEAMPLERLTMLVVPRHGTATLVVPGLEAPRVVEHPSVFSLRPWSETEDPVAIVASLVRSAGGGKGVSAIGNRTWAQFLVALQDELPGQRFVTASSVIGELRATKDAAEIEALQRAASAVDRIAAQLHRGEIALVGRTEAQVSADLSARIIAEGHDVVNFAIVAAGENAASPHHEPSSRVIRHGELVLCDFGGTMAGYCSDITRCVHIGEPPTEVAEAYAVLLEAQQAAVRGALIGVPCEEVDAIARRIISDAGYGDRFFHRTGHGIGMEAHEDPYLVSGNSEPLKAGHAFSIEPGIYTAGRWGMRLEDIVVATDDGPLAVNTVDHRLVVVDA
ncbi:MAG: M24 family metallopeptidase [Acidimicrobiia bacterium]